LVEVDLPRCSFGDFDEVARLRLLAAGTADFLGLETAAGDFAGDFAAAEDLAAGERTLPRVTRFSTEDGFFDVFDAERLELRGISAISATIKVTYILEYKSITYKSTPRLELDVTKTSKI